MRKWKDVLERIVIPVAIFVVPITLVIGIMMWLTRANPSLPEFTILNGEYFFEIRSNDIEVLHGNKLKIIIDGEVYWIRLEKDVTTLNLYERYVILEELP